MIDISPNEKKGKYVSYEPGRRVLFSDIACFENININVITDPTIKTIKCGNYYLYFYAVYWIVTLLLFAIVNSKSFQESSLGKRLKGALSSKC